MRAFRPLAALLAVLATPALAKPAADPAQVVAAERAFAADGLELTIGFWIGDPENGQVSARTAVNLTAFAADGLELTIGFWITDPENGQLNVRSGVNLAILRALAERGIEIPYPQRVVRNAAD